MTSVHIPFTHPHHLLLLRIRSLSPATRLIDQTRCRPRLSLTSRLQLPASLQNYSDEPITSSQGNQRASHSFRYYEPRLPQELLFTLFLSATLRGVQCPPPVSYVYVQLNKLQSISSVQGQVCVQPFA